MMLHEKKQIVIVFSVVVMTIGFLFFRYIPLRKRMIEVKREKQEHKMLISKASSESRRIEQLQNSLIQLTAKSKNYDERIPENRDLGGFLQRITALMDEHQLAEQNVQPGKEIKINDMVCIPVTMQCRGQVERIFRFFRSFEKLNRAVRIVRVELVNDREMNGDVIMKTQASVYYKAQVPQDS